MLYKRGICRHAVSVRHVRPSVTFVNVVKTSNRIFNFFSAPGSKTILVFPYQTSWQYFAGNPRQRGCRLHVWYRHKSRFWTNSWLSIDKCCCANNNCDGERCSLPHRAPRISESMFITTSMVDHDEEKRTKQNLKLYAAVNLKRNLRSMYCSSEDTDRHEASRGLSALAGLHTCLSSILPSRRCLSLHGTQTRYVYSRAVI